MQKLRLQWKPLSQPIKNTKDNSILLSPKLETNIYSRRFFILRFNEDKLVRGNYFFCDQDVDYMENKIPETFEDWFVAKIFATTRLSWTSRKIFACGKIWFLGLWNSKTHNPLGRNSFSKIVLLLMCGRPWKSWGSMTKCWYLQFL